MQFCSSAIVCLFERNPQISLGSWWASLVRKWPEVTAFPTPFRIAQKVIHVHKVPLCEFGPSCVLSSVRVTAPRARIGRGQDRVKLRPATMSAMTAAFLETGKNGYGAATPPEAGEESGPKKASLDVRGALPIDDLTIRAAASSVSASVRITKQGPPRSLCPPLRQGGRFFVRINSRISAGGGTCLRPRREVPTSASNPLFSITCGEQCERHGESE